MFSFFKLRGATPTLAWLLLLCSPAAAIRQGAEMSVEEYCRMSKALLEVAVDEWSARIDAAEGHTGKREQLSKKLEGVTESYRARRGEVYRRHGMSTAADLRYARAHDEEIRSYLEENPEVRDAIESLRRRVGDLIERFEAVAPGAAKEDEDEKN